MAKKKSKPRQEFDSPWKEVMNFYFQDFVAYCLPQYYKEIDWNKGYILRDKELAKISRHAVVTNRVADKLIEVTGYDGKAMGFFIHLEIQAGKEADFEERMFIYHYRLKDLYQKPIVSIAVLIDNNVHWRPSVYREECWDSYIEMGFPIIKLIDYRAKKEALEQSTNRFAPIILAQLAMLEKVTADSKLVAKIYLTKRLYRMGLKKDDILLLYRFIDWIMALPSDLEIQYHETIEVFEQEEMHVAYVTTAERIGIQKGESIGIQKGESIGIQKGESLILIELLRDKFKEISNNDAQKIKEANTQTRLKWIKKLFVSQSIEEVFEE